MALCWLLCLETWLEPKRALFAATLEPFTTAPHAGDPMALCQRTCSDGVGAASRTKGCERDRGSAVEWSRLEKGPGKLGEPWGGAAVGLCVLSRGGEALPTRVLDLRPPLKADADL